MRSTLLRRAAALLAGLGLVAGLLGVAAVPAQAAGFRVSVSASAAAVTACQGVNLTGKVSPKPSRHTVYVQQQLVGQSTWTTVAKVSTTKAGYYRTTVVPATAGDRYYRIYKAKQGKRKAGHSAKVLVRVGEQTGAARACVASSPLSGGGTTTITGDAVGTATAVTFTPQVDADQLASGFSAMPAIATRFTVVDSHTLSVRVPAGLGGKNVIAIATPSGSITADFAYQRTYRSASSFEAKVLAELNKRRASAQVCNGKKLPRVGRLSWDGGLSDLALSHSRDLAQRQDVYQGISHTTYGTKEFSTRFQLAGVTGGYGEILALSPAGSSAAKVVDQWMASTSGHCEAVMNAHWTKAGVGVANGVWQTSWGAQNSIFSNVDFQ